MRYLVYAHTLIRHPAIRNLRSGPTPVLVATLTGKTLLRLLIPASVYLAARHYELFNDAATFLLAPSSLVQFVTAYCGPLAFSCALTQSKLRERIAPVYLHLPISRMVLTSAKQASGLMQVGCLTLIAAVLGVGHGIVVPAGGGSAEAWNWIAAILSWCALAYVLGSWARYSMRSIILQLGILAATSGAIVFDIYNGGATSRVLSRLLNSYVLQSGFSVAVRVAAGLFLLLLLSARQAARIGLMLDGSPERIAGWFPLRAWRGKEHSDVIRCMMLEVRLLRRCAYPRYVFRGIGIMITFLMLLAIADPEYGGLVTSVFIVGGIPLAYAQLAFAWNSPHFDGLMRLPLDAEVHVTARAILAVSLASVTMVAALLLVLFDAAALCDVLVAYVFVCGSLVLPSISLSMRRSKFVDLDVTGFGNPRAYSWQFYIGGFVVWYGIAGLTALASDFIARSVLAGAGIMGLLLFPAWIRVLARRLNNDLAIMAGRFSIPT